MARISKDPEIRRAEFIEVAAELFRRKGYAKTSVDDIVGEAKVAKGTFYYHFKTKADVLEAVVLHLSRKSADIVEPVLGEADLDAVGKLRKLLLLLRGHYRRNSGIIDEMHGLGDDAFHTKSLVVSTKLISPILAEILRQGIGEGVFRTGYPGAVAEILLLSSNFLLDDQLFEGSGERMGERVRAIQDVAEKTLGLPPGTLYFISEWEEAE